MVQGPNYHIELVKCRQRDNLSRESIPINDGQGEKGILKIISSGVYLVESEGVATCMSCLSSKLLKVHRSGIATVPWIIYIA